MNQSISWGKIVVLVVAIVGVAGLAFMLGKKNDDRVPSAPVATMPVAPSEKGQAASKGNQGTVQSGVPEADRASSGASSPVTIDPKAQALVDQFNDLVKKVSEKARHGEPSPEEQKVIQQIMTIQGELRGYDSNVVEGAISIDAYNHDVHVAINGRNVPVAGGSSTMKRLYDVRSIMALVSSPEVREENFILKEGENTIVITYKKIKDSGSGLTLSLSAYDDAAKVLSVEADKSEGKIEKSFILKSQKPSDFQTITVSE